MGDTMDLRFDSWEDTQEYPQHIERSFILCLIRQSLGVIAGKKPASLFCFCNPCKEFPFTLQERSLYLKTLFNYFEKELSQFDLSLNIVGIFPHKIYVFLYQKKLLKHMLHTDEATTVLQQFGYDYKDASCSIVYCLKRLAAYYWNKGAVIPDDMSTITQIQHYAPFGFPHEIGIFLGYPPYDVANFIDHAGQQYTVCGAWKSYLHPEIAHILFSDLKQAEHEVWNAFIQGETLRELLA